MWQGCRPETESITQHLTTLLASSTTNKRLRILDLCSGTGCIALLLHALLRRRFPDLHILGVDVSPLAVNLAKENLKHNIARGALSPTAESEVSFVQRDILKEGSHGLGQKWDILISNPPYISPRGFNYNTSRSVRNHEPRTALVPPLGQLAESDAAGGDLFYPCVLEIADRVGAEMCLFEAGDLAQATRISALMLAEKRWAGCEIWRDWPNEGNANETIDSRGMLVRVSGKGEGRAVFVWTSGAPT